MKFINKNITSLFLALFMGFFGAAAAFAGGKSNAFAGKSYVMTGIFVGGSDVTNFLKIAGLDLNIEVTFENENTCKVKVTSDGSAEENSCEYKINTKDKTVALVSEKEGDNLTFSYSDDFTTLTASAPIQEGMNGDIVLTEKGKAEEKAALAQNSEPKIDYGSVKSNVFKGKTYRLTKILINGMDATSLLALSGEQFSGSLKFIDAKNVILDFTYGGENEKESGTYTIDYAKNTITFDGDKENGTAVFYNKASVISFDFPVDNGSMVLNLIFEK